MKMIKLTRRWIQCRDHGHTVVLRFPYFTPQAKEIESALKELTGSSGWWRDGDWYNWSGAVRDNKMRPHFINARNEHLLTMAMLKVKND